MRQSIKIALFGILSLMMAQGVQANEQHQGMAMAGSEASAPSSVINASGVVKDIDLKNKKITIAHEAIPAIGWPAMTMRFTFTTLDDSVNALKPGSRVDFSFIQQGNISLLQNINVIPS